MKHTHFKVGLFAAAIFSTTPIYADTTTTPTFTPIQQQAIEKIVHDYVVTNPQILVEAARNLQKQQASQWQNTANTIVPEIAQTLFANPTSPIAGNADGDVTLVEFFDYQCPHCKEMGPEISDLLKTDKNLRVVYKTLPIFGENSEYAALAALAAQKQGKFLVFHDALLNTQMRLTKDVVLTIAQQVGLNTKQLQTDMQNTAMLQEIKSNNALAKKLKLMGTPAFVIAKVMFNEKAHQVSSVKNPIFIPGAVDESALIQAIAQTRGK